MEQEKEEYYKEFCEIFRSKLKEITDPVIPSTSNRSYNALIDVITNVILLEINLGKKPWDEIPKTKVRLPTTEQMTKDVIWLSSPKDVAKILLEKIKDGVSYQDRNADNFSKETVASMGLFCALKNYLLSQE
mgnify:CR=1 FL=1